MSQVVCVNATDGRIKYSGRSPNDDGTLVLDGGSHFFIMFRGTSIKLYGRHRPFGVADHSFALDGRLMMIVLNGTTSGDQISLMYYSDNMEDGDHQVIWSPGSSATPIEMAYFEIENSSGGPFDFLSAGPAAQNVPSQAIAMDNSSPDIIYHSESQWEHVSNILEYYDSSLSYTPFAGGY